MMSALIDVALRRRVGFSALSQFLDDPRSRLLLHRIRVLKQHLRRVDLLADPPVEHIGDIDEETLAEAVKKIYSAYSVELASALGGVVVALQGVMEALFDVDPVVDEETGLTENLGKLYRSVIECVEKMYENLEKMQSASYPDDVLEEAASLRRHCNELKLKLQHTVIAPLEMAVRESARETALRMLGETLYGK